MESLPGQALPRELFQKLSIYFKQLITPSPRYFKAYDRLFSYTTSHISLQLLSNKERPLTPALETDTTQFHFKLSPASSAKTSLSSPKPHFPYPSFRSDLTPLLYYNPSLQYFLLFPWKSARILHF